MCYNTGIWSFPCTKRKVPKSVSSQLQQAIILFKIIDDFEYEKRITLANKQKNSVLETKLISPMHCNSPILNYRADQHILLQKFKTTFRIYYIWMDHFSSGNLNGLSKYLGYNNLILIQ